MKGKYKWLMFDLDNTLLDFSRSSYLAFFKVMKKHGLEVNDDLYKIYKKENIKVWRRFEDKEIDTDQLRKIRFKGFFDVVGISGIDPFEFNALYLKYIVETSEPYDGVIDFLKLMKAKFKLSIITNGLKEVQRPRLHKTKLYNYFDSIIVSDEIGVAKPDKYFFKYSLQSLEWDCPKDRILVIGDSLNSDIRGGNNYGLDTCWISNGVLNTADDVMPTFSVDHVVDLKEML